MPTDTLGRFNELTASGGLAVVLLVAATAAFAYRLYPKLTELRGIALLLAITAAFPASVLGVFRPIVGDANDYVGLLAGTVGGLLTQYTYHARYGSPKIRVWPIAIVVIAAVLSALAMQAGRSALMVGVLLVAFTTSAARVFPQDLLRARADASARINMIGWIALLLTMPTDMALIAGLVDPAKTPRLASAGIAILSFANLGDLCLRLVRSLREGEALNRELAARVRELETAGREVGALNVELRRQIAERSRELSEALAREDRVDVTSSEIRAGDVFDDRYRVVRLLGEGGMGAVFEVRRLSDDRRLALKVVRGDVSAVAAARLVREAEIAARIHHANLVTVMDVGITKTRLPFVVMEYIDGSSLEQERARFGDVEFALPIMRSIVLGLSALHDGGVVHRDLKPGNVLLGTGAGGERLVKIADFGISRAGNSAETAVPELAMAPTVNEAHALTRDGVLMGTPHYMSPELARGAHIAGPSADVFAFGVIAWELVIGASPFVVPPVFEALAGKKLPAAPPLPASVPAPLAHLLQRCLHEDPAARPATLELRDAFELNKVPAVVAQD
jgi:hypothetical protein